MELFSCLHSFTLVILLLPGIINHINHVHLFPKNPESLTLVKNASRLSQALKGCLELLFLDHLPALAFVWLQLSILLPVVNVQVS